MDEKQDAPFSRTRRHRAEGVHQLSSLAVLDAYLLAMAFLFWFAGPPNQIMFRILIGTAFAAFAVLYSLAWWHYSPYTLRAARHRP
jgi:high-affinity Fe2+/Pb2+ permease